MNSLQKGQHVVITGAAGRSLAEVLHTETPGNLPAISGAPEVARITAILAERHIQQLALLEHLHNGRPVCFFALGNGQGDWWDLKGQSLTIDPDN